MRNEHNPMDLMQDTYTAALTMLHQLDDKTRFVPWVSQIAVNKCKSALVKKQPVYIEPEVMAEMPVEVDENFLLESYVINEEKR